MVDSMGSILDKLSHNHNVNQKRKEYREYIQNHIENVRKAFNLYIDPIIHDTDDIELCKAITKANLNIPFHDLSKFNKEEFEPYRVHFFPTDEEKNNSLSSKEDFEKAWEHHYKNNKHHPQYWDGYDMPLEYIIEMLCDWIAMSMHFNSSTIEWWESEKTQNKEATYMTDYTKQWVAKFLYDLIPDVK